MSSSFASARAPGWRRLAARCRDLLPDLAAFAGALLCAALAALLLGGGLGGCGGGVGSEGTGTYASGAISGYGSIIVNGVHFDETAAQVQDDDGLGLDRSALALGMVVDIHAGRLASANGVSSAVASTVLARRALVGPAAAVDATAGQLSVLGQTVKVSAGTVFDERLVGGLAGVADDRLLEVYGDFDNAAQAFAATRIAPAAAGSGYRVSGPVVAVDSAGASVTLGSQAYSTAQLDSTAGLAAGALVRLNLDGTPDRDGRWVVSGQHTDARAPQGDGDAEVDGRVSSLLPGGLFVVAGVTVDASAASVSGTLSVGASVEVSGALRSGVLVARSVKVSGDGEVRRFELKGAITSLDAANRRFVLRGTTVSYARSDLVFDKGSAAQLANAVQVKVEGVLSADRTVLEAQRISVGG
jgi:hypothetical protein